MEIKDIDSNTERSVATRSFVTERQRPIHYFRRFQFCLRPAEQFPFHALQLVRVLSCQGFTAFYKDSEATRIIIDLTDANNGRAHIGHDWRHAIAGRITPSVKVNDAVTFALRRIAA